MSITLEKNFDLGKFNADFSKELNLFSQIIREDHGKRLQRGEGADGKQMKSLKDATIEAKGFNQILVNTGEMSNLVSTKATKTKQEVIINPGAKKKRGKVTNQELGQFHQEGAGDLPKREWFGISKDASRRGMKLMELRLDKELRRL